MTQDTFPSRKPTMKQFNGPFRHSSCFLKRSDLNHNAKLHTSTSFYTVLHITHYDTRCCTKHGLQYQNMYQKCSPEVCTMLEEVIDIMLLLLLLPFIFTATPFFFYCFSLLFLLLLSFPFIAKYSLIFLLLLVLYLMDATTFLLLVSFIIYFAVLMSLVVMTMGTRNAGVAGCL